MVHRHALCLYFGSALESHGAQVRESAELDVKVVKEWWGAGRSQYLSPAEQCQSKYLLYFAGNTWASRLKKQLLCNSTVVVHPSPHVGFWWHLLEHGHNVHIMEPIQVCLWCQLQQTADGAWCARQHAAPHLFSLMPRQASLSWSHQSGVPVDGPLKGHSLWTLPQSCLA